jgi:hypothetical protein
MFERFRRSSGTEEGATSVAVREREATDRDARAADDPRTRARAVRDRMDRDDRPGHGEGDDHAVPGAGTTTHRSGADEDRTVHHDPRFRRDDDAGDAALARERELTDRRAPVMGTDALQTMRSRQRERFGGIKWGSAFFGWLSAIGLAAILSGILVGAGVALGLSTSDAANAGSAETIGLGGGIALLLVLAVAWFCGGYVAGRMARFDGARQGIGVWAWTILAALLIAGLAAIGGSEYDVFQRLNLPRIAVGDSTLTSGGAITGLAAVVVTLLAAIAGGKFGERFHKRVDRVATDEYAAS